MQAYLFVHFTGEEKDGEQIYFSVSRDGLNWEDLNEGKLILRSRIGTGGVRDPYPVRHPKTGKIYLIATDLRIEAGYGWDAAQYEGSRDLIVWESEDLVHWSKERACRVGIEGAGCVWAPEAIYDEEKEAFLVFWASMVKTPEDEKPKQRIYAAYTNDFCDYSEAFLYMEREQHVIDTTMIKAKEMYYRISKDETNKCLILERSSSLMGTFIQIASPFLEQLTGVEGPECYPMPDKESWCLIADQFAEGKGYLPLLTNDLGSGAFRIPKREEYDLGKTKKRHGGVLLISEEEYERLRKATW